MSAFADYDRGMNAYNSGNYNVALMELQDAAQEGNTNAQFQLGEMYRLGQGTRPDPILAIKWLTLAYLYGKQEALPLLEMLRASVTEEQLVEAEQSALTWLEEANRTLFKDDDASLLYEQF
ncbi:MAG TPA: hypothetical protein VKZ92_05245 [Pseudohongiella sp.]|nr:hypothetical protein [Pseudohongiella sp.]